MPLIYLVAGARPNFMKIAPIVRALQSQDALSFKIIHTGQHYDRDMNEVFFEELGIPQPDIFMGAGGGSHAEQTAKIMVAFEQLCIASRRGAGGGRRQFDAGVLDRGQEAQHSGGARRSGLAQR